MSVTSLKRLTFHLAVKVSSNQKGAHLAKDHKSLLYWGCSQAAFLSAQESQGSSKGDKGQGIFSETVYFQYSNQDFVPTR